MNVTKIVQFMGEWGNKPIDPKDTENILRPFSLGPSKPIGNTKPKTTIIAVDSQGVLRPMDVRGFSTRAVTETAIDHDQWLQEIQTGLIKKFGYSSSVDRTTSLENDGTEDPPLAFLPRIMLKHA